MLKALAAALVLTAASGAALLTPEPVLAADKAAIYTPAFSKVAVEGHDPVAYFTAKKPVKGSEAFTTIYKGAEFRFASAENLAKFKADPAAYAPQYGGYCAWAVAQGYTAKGSAKNWRIVNGKLYLNYNDDIQKKWEKDIPGFITAANGNWPKVLTK
jgi:YHS domain-containing protein